MVLPGSASPCGQRHGARASARIGSPTTRRREAQWDYDLLPIEIGELRSRGFDCELLGFDHDELAELLDPGVTEGLTDPDDVPEPPDEAITQPGDLWILGDHRLLCGDSSESRSMWIGCWTANPDPLGEHGPAVQREGGTA